jgi:hypothetical protein
MASNLQSLVSWKSHAEALERDLAANRDAVALPQIRHTVGDAAIDQFGFLPGLVFFNDLRYRPRPMPVSFGSFDGEASRLNAEFYRQDATAPEYLMAMLGTIDGRLSPQDDPLTLVQMIRCYRPVLTEKGVLLLKRCAAGPSDPPRPCGELRSFAWDQAITVPRPTAGWLWCSVDIRPSAAGRIRNFLYKPFPIAVVLETQGRSYAAFKFLACAGKTGFLLDPLILSNLDLLRAYQIPLGPDVPKTLAPDSIRFRIDPAARTYYANEIWVWFSTVTEPRWPETTPANALPRPVSQ